MTEFLMIFSLVTTGSVVALSPELVLKLMTRRTQGATVAMSPARGDSTAAAPPVDPILAFGFIIAAYGALALALVAAFPGALALDRTGLAFAFMCAGGLINEISSNTGAAKPLPNLDLDDDAPIQCTPISLPLSIALTLMLNLTVAVLSSGQGLIEITPRAQAAGAAHAAELEPIVVVADRAVDSPHRAESL